MKYEATVTRRDPFSRNLLTASVTEGDAAANAGRHGRPVRSPNAEATAATSASADTDRLPAPANTTASVSGGSLAVRAGNSRVPPTVAVIVTDIAV